MLSQLLGKGLTTVKTFSKSRRSMVNCFTKGMPVSEYDPFFALSDTSFNETTGFHYTSSLLVHRGQLLKVKLDALGRDSDYGELLGSFNAADVMISYEKEFGVRIRRGIHFTDHWRVSRLINGGGNLDYKDSSYLETVQALREFRKLHLEASIHLPNQFNRLAHYFALKTHCTPRQTYNYGYFREVLMNREQEIIKDKVLLDSFFQFKIVNSGIMWYDIHISRFGYPRVVSRVQLDQNEADYYPGSSFPVVFPEVLDDIKGGDAKKSLPACKVCGRTFKSDRALQSHIKEKNHIGGK